MTTAIRPEVANDTTSDLINDILNATERTDEQRAADSESDHRINLLTMRVREIKNAKADAVADTRALKAVHVPAGDNHAAQVLVQIPNGMRMTVNDVAHKQMAQHFGVDVRYYDRMREHAPALLADNLNYWMQNTPTERLVRMLKPEALDVAQREALVGTGAALLMRGFLGKGYRTIDDADLVEAIVPALKQQGTKLVDFSIDDRRLYAKFVTDVFTMDQIRELYARKYDLTPEQMRQHRTIDGKDIAWVNEPMSFGVTIRHSEVGYASLGAALLTRIAKCTNDLVGENVVAIRHAGGKNGDADGDVRNVSDATQLMENAALLGRVQDTITQQLDPKYALERANAIVMAKVDVVERPDVPLFEFVGNVGLNIGLTLKETDQLKEETLNSIREEGGECRFAFVQGITAVARQMTDYDRRLDVERTGFALLNDDAGALLKLGRDAENAQRVAKRLAAAK